MKYDGDIKGKMSWLSHLNRLLPKTVGICQAHCG